MLIVRQKEEEEKKNKMAAVATIQAAKAAVSVNIVMPEEMKELPSITSKNGSPMRNDKGFKDT